MSAAGRQPRGYTQDYIARVRYSNALPPPSMPPKLLEVPNAGLTQFLAPAFNTRLSREQPLNIEADAELGMPLNLVGMPGVFDGNQLALFAPEEVPTPHPRDLPLLRPLSVMGKAGAETSSITFLRRPEPVSIDRPKPDAGAGMNGGGPLLSKALRGPSKPQPHPEPRPDRHKETPEHVLKTIIKGFDIAYPKSAYKGPDTAEKIQGHEPTAEEIRAWQRPQHPKRPDLRLVNSFPILPDLEAYPDTGGYITVKFATNPVPPSRTYDERLDFGILRPLEQRPELKAAQLAAAAAHAADPSKPPPGPPMFDYVYFLPEDPKTVPSLRRKLDPLEAHGDEGGDGEAGGTAFRYARIRSYETASATGGIGKKFDDIVLAMYDPVAFDTEDADVASASRKRKQKGAYYYPILQKCQIRPRRDIIVNPSMPGAPRPAPLAEEEDADQADVLSLVIRAPDEAERARRGQLRSEYDPNAPVVQPAEDAAADADPNGAANGTTNGHAAEQGE